MDAQQLTMVGEIICGVLLLLAVIILWLATQVRQLKQAHTNLSKQLQRSDTDVVGLCSAAIVVDRRLADSESQLALMARNQVLRQVSEVAAEVEEQPQLAGYAKAIQMIIRGASVEELVQSCGMTRDEAMLLISVNRSKDLQG